jgi:hypothetical protein
MVPSSSGGSRLRCSAGSQSKDCVGGVPTQAESYKPQVKAPANAYVLGDKWYCNNGFRKVGNQCNRINVPANAYVLGDKWYCNNGFRKVGNQCNRINVPAKSYVLGDKWYCNNGFRKVGKQCNRINVPAFITRPKLNML